MEEGKKERRKEREKGKKKTEWGTYVEEKEREGERDRSACEGE